MKLTHMAGGCGDGPCPNGFRTDMGSWVVQGKRVTDYEALRTLKLPDHETAVEVPEQLIRDMAKALGMQ